MKHAIKSLLIGSSMLAATSAHAELETEIHAGYHGIYEFRGVDFGDNLYEGGIDLSYDLGSGFSLSGGIWYADSNGSGGNFEEVDYYMGLTKTIGKVDLSVGYTYYAFPGNDSAKTDEFSIGLSHEMECGLGLSLTFFKDVDDIQGEYLEFEATKSYELSSCVNLDLAVGAAWSFDYNPDTNGNSLDGFNHYFVKVALPWTFAENATLTPYIKFVGAGSNLGNDFDDGSSSDLFYGGISISYSF